MFPENLGEITMSMDDRYLEEVGIDPLLPKEEIDFDKLAAGFSKAYKIITPALSAWKTPILIIAGEHDPVAPPIMIRQWIKEIKNVRAYEIKNGHHDILNDWCHKSITRLISGFICEVTGPELSLMR